ncbi:ribulose-phosphate 3-epimerase [Candidatus Uhrbacteria bacterium]|nr:ribulose-phosphate 3-epimerase [Candidatus Uhrbacteria bacterium]
MKPIKNYLKPALLLYSRKEGEKKVAFIAKHYPHSWVHIDVMDNKFVPNTCWCSAGGFAGLRIKNPQEIHLMVLHPEIYVKRWKRAKAKRIIFHIESTKKPEAVARAIRNLDMEAYIALNPDTPVEKLRLLINNVDGILLMGVYPGLAGQKFIPAIVPKIKKTRLYAATKPITVDGGVTFQNAADLIDAGATELVSTSAVFSGRFKKEFGAK